MLLNLVLASMPEVDFVHKPSPEGDRPANGLAEVGRREAARSQLEASLGTRLGEDEPTPTWLFGHATNCVNSYRIGNDGRTAE